MLYRIYKLHFTTPVRFGRNNDADTQLNFLSDTLFSALYLALQPIGKADDLLDAVRSDSLRFSDGLPYYGDELYLPRPKGMYAANSREDVDPSERKLLKRITYLPSDRMTEWFQGTLTPKEVFTDFGTPFMSARVNRRDAIPLPYQIQGFRFHDRCGLYVIMAAKDEDVLSVMDVGMNLLTADGIGGRISSGWGHFQMMTVPVTDALEAALNDNQSSHQMLLNAALPDDDEGPTVMKDARYLLVRRGGFTKGANEKPVKKRTTWLLSAGSTFTRRFNGQVLDVSVISTHPVWRYAKALMIGVKTA